ncbi:hypothetical protein GCM10028822_14720 [Hymenobacter terrigena]
MGGGVPNDPSKAREVDVTGRSAEQASSSASGMVRRRYFIIGQNNAMFQRITIAGAKLPVSSPKLPLSHRNCQAGSGGALLLAQTFLYYGYVETHCLRRS